MDETQSAWIVGKRAAVAQHGMVAFHFARPNGVAIDPRWDRLVGGVHELTPAWAMGY